MNTRLKQLRDLVVALDRADRNLDPVDPDVYRAAASVAFDLTKEEMGLLPIADFAGPVNALQNMAENIFFGSHGCFADIDGSGRAPVASRAARALLERLQAHSAGAAEEVTDGLFARLRAAPSKRRTSTRRRKGVDTRA